MNAPASLDRADLIDALADLVTTAGRVIMEVYATDFAVATKGDDSPVTIADTRAEEIILTGLARIAPKVAVVAEEAFSASAPNTSPDASPDAISDTFFLVDPLDGTREFVNRNGEFTVNIALIEHGTPTAGVVFAPALDRMFCAGAPGQACEILSHEGQRRPIKARSCPPDGWVAVASRSHRDDSTNAYLTALGVEETRSAGSSLKFCLIAAGEADIYPRFGPTCEWDTAAGHAILLHAGGNLCRLDGEPFDYAKREQRFLNPGFLAWGNGPRPPLPDPALWRANLDDSR